MNLSTSVATMPPVNSSTSEAEPTGLRPLLTMYIHTITTDIEDIPVTLGVLSFHPYIPQTSGYDSLPAEEAYAEYHVLNRHGKRSKLLERLVDDSLDHYFQSLIAKEFTSGF